MNAEWVTGVAGQPERSISKHELRMEPNRPNPFKQWTRIDYQLPAAGTVSLKVYNVAGQLVRTLAEGFQPAGAHAVRWDGRDDRGREVSSGVYLYRLTAGSGTATRKLTVVR
ncbi:T9SS type A sorting domain-containing protein [bacterium]|nr:T9SS type A sorting domain-containing protein [bacterium]